jgi:hypothetical protein
MSTLPIRSALVTNAPRVLSSFVVIVCSLKRYTGLTARNPEFPANRIIHLRLLRKTLSGHWSYEPHFPLFRLVVCRI